MKRSRRFGVALVAVGLAVGLLAACGSSSSVGGGGGGLVPKIGGKAAQRTAAVTGYQANVVGMALPYLGLQVTAPQGSPIVASRAIIPLDRILGLYAGPIERDGRYYQINYYTDVALTKLAGWARFGLPSGVSTDNVYGVFPAQVSTELAVTAGKVPAQGRLTTTFLDVSGANRMRGTILFPRHATTMDLDLALDSALQVTGQTDITVAGVRGEVRNITGHLTGPLTGDLYLRPLGWVGTCTFSLTGEVYGIDLQVGGLRYHAATNEAGGLELNYTDGTLEQIADPLVARWSDPVEP